MQNYLSTIRGAMPWIVPFYTCNSDTRMVAPKTTIQNGGINLLIESTRNDDPSSVRSPDFAKRGICKWTQVE
ncbi:hypothetical protein ACWGOQ_0010755 [Aquimarina sp. M1]